MSTVYITRKETFNAAHKLSNPEWSDEQNLAVFGKCSNKNWHGHNYTLFVTVKGKPSKETGFVINLKTLSKIVNREVIDQMDHKNLNLDVPFMKGVMPSAENIAIQIWKQLEEAVQAVGGELAKVKLYETENNFVEYYGGKKPY